MTKFEQDFKEYLLDNQVYREICEHSYSNGFFDFPDSMKFGVYQDFMDKAGIGIGCYSFNDKRKIGWGYFIHVYHGYKVEESNPVLGYATLDECRKAALKKAIDLYNKKHAS